MQDIRALRLAMIVGAPRTGTTSLARFLRAHDDVCFSNVKEPHFFSRWDFTSYSDAELREIAESEYLDRFFPHRERSSDSILAEGSVTYLYVPERVSAILRLWPDAKFIISVRDPMELLPSLHQRLLFLGDEDVEDFATAWRLIGERKNGRKIPRTCIEPRWLRYDEIGRLGHYAEQFVAMAGRERCHFVVHDDLRSCPEDVYRGVERYLGLPEASSIEVKSYRSSQGYRYGWLQRLLMRPPVARRVFAGRHYRRRVDALHQIKAGENRFLSAVEKARAKLLRWNRDAPPKAVLSPRLRAELRSFYLDDVKQLGRLLNRDLAHWLKVQPNNNDAAYRGPASSDLHREVAKLSSSRM